MKAKMTALLAELDKVIALAEELEEEAVVCLLRIARRKLETKIKG